MNPIKKSEGPFIFRDKEGKPNLENPVELPSYRYEVFKEVLKTNTEKIQKILLEPFFKEHKNTQDMTYITITAILLPTLIPLIAFSAIVLIAAAHLLFYTAIGKLPEGQTFTYGDL